MTLFKLRRAKQATAAGSAPTGAAWRRALSGLFSRTQLDDAFWDELEEALIIADVGVPATVSLLNAVRETARQDGLRSPADVRRILRLKMAETLDRAALDGSTLPENARVALIVVGVNGSGKTTTIAKLARAAAQDGRRVLLAAADTFRAGAIEQLRTWANRLGVDLVAHGAGADPGAVAFDAVAAARARKADLVIVDTAGRLHTRHNLMQELKKVRSVVEREAADFERRVVLVIDGTTGQNGLAQARAFTEVVSCDGVILTKLDGTARGGVVLAIAAELKLPVWFVGTGESAEDLAEFDTGAFVDTLLPEASHS